MTKISFHKRELLAAALYVLACWEQDQQRLGIGTVELSFDGCSWTVLLSEDLLQAALYTFPQSMGCES